MHTQNKVIADGGTVEEGLSMAGMITGIAQTFALIFSVIAGYMSTRLNAMFSLLLLSLVGVLGYGAYVPSQAHCVRCGDWRALI